MIAIIAILAAILFPVFARARENARRSSCQSNLKQIALGIKQYTQDYDEKFPYATNTNLTTTGATPAGPGPLGWSDGIQPYVKSTQILQCPSDDYALTDVPNNRGYTDYAINAELSNSNFANSLIIPPATALTAADAAEYGNGGISEAAVQKSAVTIMICEGSTGVSGNSASFRMNGQGASVTGSRHSHLTPTHAGGLAGNGLVNSSNMATLHLDGANIAFVDGHVKWYKFSETGGAGQTRTRIYKEVVPASISGESPTFAVTTG